MKNQHLELIPDYKKEIEKKKYCPYIYFSIGRNHNKNTCLFCQTQLNKRLPNSTFNQDHYQTNIRRDSAYLNSTKDILTQFYYQVDIDIKKAIENKNIKNIQTGIIKLQNIIANAKELYDFIVVKKNYYYKAFHTTIDKTKDFFNYTFAKDFLTAYIYLTLLIEKVEAQKKSLIKEFNTI